MPQETEIKLPVESARQARQMLKNAGFHVSRRRLFEGNVIFDTAKGTLRRSRTLVRIRETGGTALLDVQRSAGALPPQEQGRGRDRGGGPARLANRAGAPRLPAHLAV